MLASASLQAHSPADLIRAGQEALDSFKPSLLEAPAEHGFATQKEVNALVLGAPLPVCRINDVALSEYAEGQPVTPVLLKPQTWFFPVMLGDETRSILSITELKGTSNLVPEAFGKAVLAESIGQFIRQFGAEDLVVVTGRQPLDLYIHIQSVARPNLSPLTGDRKITEIFILKPADALPVIDALRAK